MRPDWFPQVRPSSSPDSQIVHDSLQILTLSNFPNIEFPNSQFPNLEFPSLRISDFPKCVASDFLMLSSTSFRTYMFECSFYRFSIPIIERSKFRVSNFRLPSSNVRALNVCNVRSSKYNFGIANLRFPNYDVRSYRASELFGH